MSEQSWALGCVDKSRRGVEDDFLLLALAICQSLYLLFPLGPTPGVSSRETALPQLL